MKSMTKSEFKNFVLSGYVPTSQDDKNDVADIIGYQAIADLVVLISKPETEVNATKLFAAIMGETEFTELVTKSQQLKNAFYTRNKLISQIEQLNKSIAQLNKSIAQCNETINYYGFN